MRKVRDITITYQYYPDGRLKSYHFTKPVAYSDDIDMTVTYGYDAFGNRTSIKEVGKRWVKKADGAVVVEQADRLYVMLYNGPNVETEYLDEGIDGTCDRRREYRLTHVIDRATGFKDYFPSASPARDPEEYDYITDQVGSVLAIKKSGTDEVIEKYAYDAQGNLIRAKCSFAGEQDERYLDNRYRFQFREQDLTARHYYFRMRVYEPSIGQFLTPDPELRLDSEGTALALAMGGNMVNFDDPMGTCDQCGQNYLGEGEDCPNYNKNRASLQQKIKTGEQIYLQQKKPSLLERFKANAIAKEKALKKRKEEEGLTSFRDQLNPFNTPPGVTAQYLIYVGDYEEAERYWNMVAEDNRFDTRQMMLEEELENYCVAPVDVVPYTGMQGPSGPTFGRKKQKPQIITDTPVEPETVTPKYVKTNYNYENYGDDISDGNFGRTRPSRAPKRTVQDVYIVGKDGNDIGQLDVWEVMPNGTRVFIEQKSGLGIGKINPKTGLPYTDPVVATTQFGEKQILLAGRKKARSLLEGVATRGDGGAAVPSIDEIQRAKNIRFEIEADTPAIRTEVNNRLEQLRQEFPEFTFEAEFGK